LGTTCRLSLLLALLSAPSSLPWDKDTHRITHQGVEETCVVPEPRVHLPQVLQVHFHQHGHIVPAQQAALCSCTGTWRPDSEELLLDKAGPPGATGQQVSKARGQVTLLHASVFMKHLQQVAKSVLLPSCSLHGLRPLAPAWDGSKAWKPEQRLCLTDALRVRVYSVILFIVECYIET
jgi:hypothetical protein